MKKNLPPVDLESVVVVAAAVEKSSHFVAEIDAHAVAAAQSEQVPHLHNLHFDRGAVVAAVAVDNYTF